MEKNKLKIGEVGIVIRDDNLQNLEHNITKGTLFTVVGYDGHHGYEVRFLPYNKYKILNSRGPFLRYRDAMANDGTLSMNTLKILYE